MSEIIFSDDRYKTRHYGSQGPDWPTVRNGDATLALITGMDFLLAGFFINMDWWWIHSNNHILLRRGVLYFDTSSLPADAALSAAKIQMNVEYYDDYADHATPVMEVVHFVRAPGIEYPLSTYKEANWDYLSNCSIKCGGLLVSPAMTEPQAVEVDLNAAGIASIVKGGATIFGFMSDRDIDNSSPADKTRAGAKITAMKLVVTYEEAGALKVVTIAATDVTKTSLTVNGQITQGAATKRGFDWGLAADTLINDWYEEGTFGVEEFSHAVTGLTPGQDFCHRAKAC